MFIPSPSPLLCRDTLSQTVDDQILTVFLRTKKGGLASPYGLSVCRAGREMGKPVGEGDEDDTTEDIPEGDRDEIAEKA